MKTAIGRFLDRRSISITDVARKTGLAEEHLIEMTETAPYYPEAIDVKLIALAIKVPPAELFEYLTRDVRLVISEPSAPSPDAPSS